MDSSVAWCTVSNAADRSNKIKTDNWADVLASLSDSDTDRTAVSVEWPRLKPGCRGSSRLLLVRK